MEFNELRKQYLALKKLYDEEMGKRGKEIIFETVKPLFDKHPCLESFAVTSYTPSFNDGDPSYNTIMLEAESMEWSFHEDDEDENDDEIITLPEDDEVLITVKTDEDFEDDEEDCEDYDDDDDDDDNGYDEKYASVMDEVVDTLLDFQDDWESVFDTNCSVIFTKDGVEIEDYDCGR